MGPLEFALAALIALLMCLIFFCTVLALVLGASPTKQVIKVVELVVKGFNRLP